MIVVNRQAQRGVPMPAADLRFGLMADGAQAALAIMECAVFVWHDVILALSLCIAPSLSESLGICSAQFTSAGSACMSPARTCGVSRKCLDRQLGSASACTLGSLVNQASLLRPQMYPVR